MAYQTRTRDPLLDTDMSQALEKRGKELLGLALIGLGLMRQMRLVAYLGFLMGLLGVIVSLGFGMSAFGAERYAFLGITLFDLLAVIFLFGILWRTPQKA